MSFLSKQVYDQTLELIAGRAQLPPVFARLAQYIDASYGVETLNFEYAPMFNDSRMRLYVVLRKSADYNSMRGSGGYDKKKQQAIAARFCALSAEFGAFGAPKPGGVFVAFCNFAAEYVEKLGALAFRKIETAIAEKCGAALWRATALFGRLFVFYYTDEQVSQNAKNGLSDAISALFYDKLRELDGYDILRHEQPAVVFDSKQTVDEKCEGSLFYYFR